MNKQTLECYVTYILQQYGYFLFINKFTISIHSLLIFLCQNVHIRAFVKNMICVQQSKIPKHASWKVKEK